MEAKMTAHIVRMLLVVHRSSKPIWLMVIQEPFLTERLFLYAAESMHMFFSIVIATLLIQHIEVMLRAYQDQYLYD